MEAALLVRYEWRVAAVRYAGDTELVQALRDGEEAAFAYLVDSFGASMQRVAALYVRDRAVVQEVVQDTWLAVLRGIDRFESRSSLRTWLFSILVNIAKTRGVRESRSVPFASIADDPESRQESVPADRFLGDDSAWPGHWAATALPEWDRPLERLLSGELRTLISAAVTQLPEMQRRVVSLRDIEGWSAGEVCNVLELSETNQRVLLHRARSRLRDVIDRSGILEN
jgi:RNA polymerase sigma-70 factor (ECF subfamily)